MFCVWVCFIWSVSRWLFLQGFLLEHKPENAAAIIQVLNQVAFIFLVLVDGLDLEDIIPMAFILLINL